MPNPTPQPLTTTGTVRATIATVVLYFATRYGWDPEVANAVAVIGAAVVAVFLRRGVEKNGPAAALLFFLVLPFLPWCCAHPDPLPVFRVADRALEMAERDYQGGASFPLSRGDPEKDAILLAARIKALAAARAAVARVLKDDGGVK
jgi:hypothetical protein